MMGNVVVWKPWETHGVLRCQCVDGDFKKAGVPDGVINLIYPSGPVAGGGYF
jgi:1-pyrroline-5-carboxylate dehydrogenase